VSQAIILLAMFLACYADSEIAVVSTGRHRAVYRARLLGFASSLAFRRANRAPRFAPPGLAPPIGSRPPFERCIRLRLPHQGCVAVSTFWLTTPQGIELPFS
jgi:hypothetical protein